MQSKTRRNITRFYRKHWGPRKGFLGALRKKQLRKTDRYDIEEQLNETTELDVDLERVEGFLL